MLNQRTFVLRMTCIIFYLLYELPGVVEWKNICLEELVRMMINKTNIHKYLRTDVVSNVCYMINRGLIRPILKIPPYKIYKGKNLNISHLHVFTSQCFVLNNKKDNLGKSEVKVDEGLFLGYSTSNKTFRILIKKPKY